MKVNPDEHYDENYFYPNKKVWVDQFGVMREYYGPSKDWHGFSDIASWLRNRFPNSVSLLDIGCGAGGFVSRAKAFNFECLGVDISRYAVQNCVKGAEGMLKLLDITKTRLPYQYDIVTALDLLEHIYQKNIDSLLESISAYVKPGGHFFACVATARNESEVWSHTSSEDEVPADKNWLAVSGHVNVQFFDYWIGKLEEHGFETRYDKMMKFQIWRMSHHELHVVDSWGCLNVYIGRKR